MVLEYNKNFEWAPPENMLLWRLFTLNQSFKSIILLSYYGNIGYAIRESNSPITTIVYLNQTQYGQFLGLPFGEGFYLNNNRYYNCNGYHYAYITNVHDLNSNIAVDLAKNYYDIDYAQYLEANARLKPFFESNSEELNKSLQDYINAFREGNKTKEHYTKLHYFRLADKYGYTDAGARKILEDEEMKILGQKEFVYTPFWHTVASAIIFLILGLIFIVSSRKIKRYEEQEKDAAVAYVSYSLDALLSLGGFAYFIFRSPNDLFILQWWVILQWLVILYVFSWPASRLAFGDYSILSAPKLPVSS
jgi:hypothetical protein